MTVLIPYTKMIESDKPWKTADGQENVLKGKMTLTLVKGRTEGVSGTQFVKQL